MFFQQVFRLNAPVTNRHTYQTRTLINTHTRIDLLHLLYMLFSDAIFDLADLGPTNGGRSDLTLHRKDILNV